MAERLVLTKAVCGYSYRNSLLLNNFGAWLSPVERLVRDQEVGGSNPLAPTKCNITLIYFNLSHPENCISVKQIIYLEELPYIIQIRY